MKKLIMLVSGISLMASSAVLAQAGLTKGQTKEQVISACQSEAVNRYGEDAIKFIGKKSKWMKSLKGAAVKMKVKPKSKRLTRFSCVLGMDEQVTFYKA